MNARPAVPAMCVPARIVYPAPVLVDPNLFSAKDIRMSIAQLVPEGYLRGSTPSPKRPPFRPRNT